MRKAHMILDLMYRSIPIVHLHMVDIAITRLYYSTNLLMIYCLSED